MNVRIGKMANVKIGNRLSPKQAAFCKAYIAGGSCGAAMRAAGYSDSYANTHGTAILDIPAVKAELERLQVKVEADFDVTLQEVVANARWLVRTGKDRNCGADVSAGNLQLGRSIGAFSDRVIEQQQELPVKELTPETEDELRAMAERLKLKIAGGDRPALVGEPDGPTDEPDALMDGEPNALSDRPAAG